MGIVPAAPSASARAPRGQRWIYAFVAIQFVCALALLVNSLAGQRVVFRSAAIGASLAYLLLVPRTSGSLPLIPRRRGPSPYSSFSASRHAIPTGARRSRSSFIGRSTLAVLAPLFWIGRLDLDQRTLGRLLLILWLYHSVSSVVGLLQVYFPGTFQPALPMFIKERQVLSIRLRVR